MAKVTNNSKALQGVQTLAGTVYLKPGETRDDLAFSDVEAAHLKSLAIFNLHGVPRANHHDADNGALNTKVAELEASIITKDAEIAALKQQIDADDDKTPGRDELKAQAKELGIDFARNATNEKLKELIDAKLAA